MAITWLIVLILGEMPRPLHEAIAAVTRYLARVSGYMYLLTSAYPAGLFGDQSEGIIVADYDSVPSEQQWQLVLSGSAKALVSLFLGAGAATIIGITVILLLAATTPSG